MLTRTAPTTEPAVQESQPAAPGTLESLKDGVAQLRQAAPAALGRAVEQVHDVTRRGLDRAHDLSDGVREKAQRANDRTIGYIQDEPRKAVLWAAAAGAALALLALALSGRRG